MYAKNQISRLTLHPECHLAKTIQQGNQRNAGLASTKPVTESHRFGTLTEERMSKAKSHTLLYIPSASLHKKIQRGNQRNVGLASTKSVTQTHRFGTLTE